MDLQLRKIQFVKNFLSINNEQVINELEHLLERKSLNYILLRLFL